MTFWQFIAAKKQTHDWEASLLSFKMNAFLSPKETPKEVFKKGLKRSSLRLTEFIDEKVWISDYLLSYQKWTKTRNKKWRFKKVIFVAPFYFFFFLPFYNFFIIKIFFLNNTFYIKRLIKRKIVLRGYLRYTKIGMINNTSYII